MKVLFLDIDGVVNSGGWYDRRDPALRKQPSSPYNDGMAELDPEAMMRLNRVIEATGCVVVLSSAWRRIYTIPEMREVLAARGFVGDLIDATPILTTKHDGLTRAQRGDEIALWLETARDVEAYAVVDDTDDMDAVEERFVLTNWSFGLLDEHVDQLIALLGAIT